MAMRDLAESVWLKLVARAMAALGAPIGMAVVWGVWGIWADVAVLKFDAAAVSSRLTRLETKVEDTIKEEAALRRQSEVNDTRQNSEIEQIRKWLERLETAFGQFKRSGLTDGDARDHL